MNCSLLVSVHGDSSGKNTGVGCHALVQGKTLGALVYNYLFSFPSLLTLCQETSQEHALGQRNETDASSLNHKDLSLEHLLPTISPVSDGNRLPQAHSKQTGVVIPFS